MTYLFLIIAIAIINSLSDKKISFVELLFTNVAIVSSTYLLEKVWLLRHESRKSIIYEKIELIKPENHKALIEDLKERTGLNIHRVQIGKIDFLRDVVTIKIFYFEDDLTPIDDVIINNENE
jgi:hypothetical protein